MNSSFILGMLALLLFFTVITFGSLYLYHKKEQLQRKPKPRYHQA